MGACVCALRRDPVCDPVGGRELLRGMRERIAVRAEAGGGRRSGDAPFRASLRDDGGDAAGGMLADGVLGVVLAADELLGFGIGQIL